MWWLFVYVSAWVLKVLNPEILNNITNTEFWILFYRHYFWCMLCSWLQSQLSADAACFVPSQQWHSTTSQETSAAVPSGAVLLQESVTVHTTKQLSNEQSTEQWWCLLSFFWVLNKLLRMATHWESLEKSGNLKMIRKYDRNVFLPMMCYHVQGGGHNDGHRVRADFTWLRVQQNVNTCSMICLRI